MSIIIHQSAFAIHVPKICHLHVKQVQAQDWHQVQKVIAQDRMDSLTMLGQNIVPTTNILIKISNCF